MFVVRSFQFLWRFLLLSWSPRNSVKCLQDWSLSGPYKKTITSIGIRELPGPLVAPTLLENTKSMNWGTFSSAESPEWTIIERSEFCVPRDFYFAPSSRDPLLTVNDLSCSNRFYTYSSTALQWYERPASHLLTLQTLSTIETISFQIHVVKARTGVMALLLSLNCKLLPTLLLPLNCKLLPTLKTPHQGHVWITLSPTPPLQEGKIQVRWKRRSELVLIS